MTGPPSPVQNLHLHVVVIVLVLFPKHHLRVGGCVKGQITYIVEELVGRSVLVDLNHLLVRVIPECLPPVKEAKDYL